MTGLYLLALRAIVVTAALVLTACAQSNTPDPLAVPAGQCKACDVTEFYAKASLLSAAAGQKMLRGRVDNPCDQLRLAILLSAPNTAFSDDVQAGQLLRDFLQNPGHVRHPNRGFASLLADAVDERRKLKTTLQILANLKKNLAQEQIVSQALAEKLEREHGAAKSLRTQLRALQSQLDQLKSIELDINKKEQSVATPTTDREADGPNQDTAD